MSVRVSSVHRCGECQPPLCLGISLAPGLLFTSLSPRLTRDVGSISRSARGLGDRGGQGTGGGVAADPILCRSPPCRAFCG